MPEFDEYEEGLKFEDDELKGGGKLFESFRLSGVD